MTAATELHVIDGMSDAEYHAHPALSSSGARKLLPPSCPALYRWERDNPPAPRRAFDLGHAAHRMILGEGLDFVVIEHTDYRTKEAQRLQAEAHAAGTTPILRHEYEAVRAMAAAVRSHPLASALIQVDNGKPEQSLFWVDDETGVPCRARLDWMRTPIPGRRQIAVDVKTTVSAEPGYLRKAVHNHGYHQQQAWYIDGIRAVGLAEDVAFLFVFVEKTPPHLVTVVELDPDAVRIGRELNRRAIEVFRDCTASGIWPSYTNDIQLVALPRWAERQHEETYVD